MKRAASMAASARLQRIAVAVTGKHRASCFASAVSAATILHAMDILRVEPTRAEDRRWNYLFQGVASAIPLMDLRTLCNVLSAGSRMLVRAFSADRHNSASPQRRDASAQQQQSSTADVPPTDVLSALLDLQMAVLSKVTTEDTMLTSSQTLSVFESLSRLRTLPRHSSNAAAVNEELWFLVKERSPVLSDQVGNIRDLASLLNVVSSNSDEWSNPSVVEDVLRSGQRILGTKATHQDAMTLFDAITRRTVDRHGSVSVYPIPLPLRPILQNIFGVLLPKHIDELSPAQLAAWFSRIIDEYSSRGDSTSKLLWGHEAGGRITKRVASEAYDATTARLLLTRARRGASLEVLSNSALRTLSLAVSRIWTPPKIESKEAHDVSAANAEHVRHVEHTFCLSLVDGVEAQHAIIEEIRTRLKSGAAPVGHSVVAPPQANVVESMVEALAAVPPLLYDCSCDRPGQTLSGGRAVSAQQGLFALLCNVLDAHLKRHPGGNLGIPNSSRTRASLVAVGLHIALIPAGTATAAQQHQDNMWNILEGWCTSKRNMWALPVIDLVCLVNELCAYTFSSSYVQRQHARGHRRNHMSQSPDAHSRSSQRLNELLLGMHDVIRGKMSELQRGVGSRGSTTDDLRLLSTGQLLRYISSMSKLGVRKKGEYMLVATEISGRGFMTNFELLRLLNVASRKGLHLPFLLNSIAANLVALQRSLLPAQKVMLVKAMGQMGHSWNDLCARRMEVIAPAGDDALQSTSVLPLPNPDEGRGRRQRTSPQPSAMDWNVGWFLDGNDGSLGSADIKFLDAISLITGWVRVQLDASAACRNLLATVAGGGARLVGVVRSQQQGRGTKTPRLVVSAFQVLSNCLRDGSRGIGQIASLNVALDLVVSLAFTAMHLHTTTKGDTERTARQGHELTRDDVEMLLTAAVRHAVAVIAGAPTQGLSFQDLSLLSLHWGVLQRVAATTGADVAASIQQLHDAARLAVSAKLSSIARSRELRPNTFAVSQLRIGITFGALTEETFFTDSVVTPGVPASIVSLADWDALVANIALDRVVLNATKLPKELADTHAVIDLAVVLRLYQRQPICGTLSLADGAPFASLVDSFQDNVLPACWDFLSQDEQQVIRALIPGCKCPPPMTTK